MTIHFRTKRVSSWPPMAWVAKCCPGEAIEVLHGPLVEVSDLWFGEIVWDGDYQSGDFDLARHAYGSGGRIRETEIIFVSSASVVDRLHWIQKENTTWVSNSIAAITKESGLTADPTCSRYPAIFQSICRGTKQYERVVPMVGGEVHLSYMNNLHWDGQALHERPKPVQVVPLRNYEEYRSQLSQVIVGLGRNWSDALRCHPFKAISTISTGYDSPAATVVAREAGLDSAITIAVGRSGDVDDGSIIARHLGVPIQVLSRQAWRTEPDAESTYIASDAKGEDVYFAGAAEILRGSVLLTGYGGTRVWGIKPALNEDYQRGDQSGLSHCEARLHLGYVHLPVPFLVADQTADLRRISSMSEMQPWHVRDAYNCPIARRIVEAAGVPRSEFGMKKKAASILFFDSQSFLSDSSNADFSDWYTASIPVFSRLKFAVVHGVQKTACGILAAILRTTKMVHRVSGIHVVSRFSHSSRLNELASFQPRYQHLFPWALAKTQLQYIRDSKADITEDNTND